MTPEVSGVGGFAPDFEFLLLASGYEQRKGYCAEHAGVSVSRNALWKAIRLANGTISVRSGTPFERLSRLLVTPFRPETPSGRLSRSLVTRFGGGRYLRG